MLPSTKFAILGARGLIGRQVLKILEERRMQNVTCFGNKGGANVIFGDQTLLTQPISAFEPENYDVIFSAIDAAQIKPWKERIIASGAVWIDKSSAMRMDSDVPLVVPEVNGSVLAGAKVAASPNCVAIPVAMFLKAVGVYEPEFVNISTYQAISGAGREAISAFFKEMKAFSMSTPQKGLFYEHPMAFNVIPAIGAIDENGDSDEEAKIVQELSKILGVNYEITATCMRVPVSIGHTASVFVRTQKPVKIEQIRMNMEKMGIIYSEALVTPLMAAREDNVFACRLRAHSETSISILLVADNLRKGGALNAWQMAELMTKLND